MSNKKISIIVLILLLVSFVNAEISIFSFSESQSQNTILNNMDLAIIKIDEQGYDSRRFVDIYREAEFYEDNNIMFYRTASLFRNTTILARDTINEFESLESQFKVIEDMNIHNESISKRLDQVADYISQAKYESAQRLFSLMEEYILTQSGYIFDYTQTKYWGVEYEYNLLDITTDVMGDVNSKLPSAKKSVSISKELIDELQEINVSIQNINSIKYHLQYFNNNNIVVNKINDIYEESIYNFERKRYDKILSLGEESNILYNKAVNYKQEYQKTFDRISKLKESEKKTEFESELSASYDLYKNSELDDATEKLDKLNEDILDFESQLIAFTNVEIEHVPILELIMQNLVAVIGTIVVIIILTLIVSMQVKRYVHSKKIMHYEKEKDNLEQLMKDIQFKYYDEKSISKKAYESKIKIYQNKFIEVTRKLALLSGDK